MTAAFRAVGLGWQPAERLPSHTAAKSVVRSGTGADRLPSRTLRHESELRTGKLAQSL